MVVLCPAPSFMHRGHHCLKRAMGVNYSLRTASCSTCVDDHCVLAIWQHFSVLAEKTLALKVDVTLVEVIHWDSNLFFDAFKPWQEVGVCDNNVSSRVLCEVFNFTLCAARRDRNSNTIEVPSCKLRHWMKHISVCHVENSWLLDGPFLCLSELNSHLTSKCPACSIKLSVC